MDSASTAPRPQGSGWELGVRGGDLPAAGQAPRRCPSCCTRNRPRCDLNTTTIHAVRPHGRHGPWPSLRRTAPAARMQPFPTSALWLGWGTPEQTCSQQSLRLNAAEYAPCVAAMRRRRLSLPPRHAPLRAEAGAPRGGGAAAGEGTVFARPRSRRTTSPSAECCPRQGSMSRQAPRHVANSGGWRSAGARDCQHFPPDDPQGEVLADNDE